MFALAALLLSSAASATVPAGALLDAFRAACDRVDNLDQMRAAAAAAGWEEVAEAADHRIERLTRLGREAAPDGWMSGANFSRTIGGRRLYLIVSRHEDSDGLWGNGCRLYDFDAADPIDPAALEHWMGRPPTGVEHFGGIGGRRLWEPGWRDGVTVEVSHVPAGSEFRETLGFSGNILIAQAIGGF